NAYLIYIIIVTKVKHVGQYRWLLLSFAVVDILISLVHFALVPEVYRIDLFASNLPGFFGIVYWV
ncbi:hypothetical protein PFISCL1PPCAC_13719, partial [Pristionchus fissidentatus]